MAAGWARAHVGQGTFVADRVPQGAPAPPAPMPRLDWSGLLSKRAQVVWADMRRQAPREVARPSRRADLLRGRHAGQHALPHRRVPPCAQHGDPRGGAGAAPVLRAARAIRRCASTWPAICSASAWRRGRKRSSSSMARSRASTSWRAPSSIRGTSWPSSGRPIRGRCRCSAPSGPSSSRCRWTPRGSTSASSSACSSGSSPSSSTASPARTIPPG